MGLAKTYCKEIAKDLEKIAVFPPGSPVKVGDIITFGSGLFNGGAVGSFETPSSLGALGVDFGVTDDGSPDTYIYTSQGAVGIVFTANANAGSAANGKMEIKFNKSGATYFAAVDCTVKRMTSTVGLKEKLEQHKDSINWKSCFIVTSVTTASKALIMQSNTSAANLVIDGDVKGLQPGAGVSVDASASVSINSYKDSSLIKPWSDDVTVFVGLSTFRKKLLGGWGVESGNLGIGGEEFELTEMPAGEWMESVEIDN